MSNSQIVRLGDPASACRVSFFAQVRERRVRRSRGPAFAYRASSTPLPQTSARHSVGIRYEARPRFSEVVRFESMMNGGRFLPVFLLDVCTDTLLIYCPSPGASATALVIPSLRRTDHRYTTLESCGIASVPLGGWRAADPR